MKRFFLPLLAFACLYSVTTLAADASDAKSFVDGLATQVLAIVKDTEQSKDAKTQKIEALFTDKVDIDFVAKFVLGKHWREATPQQQQDYIGAYKPFILKNYAGRLTRYSGQTYVLKNARSEGDSDYVTMEIKDPNGQDIGVDYRLRKSGPGRYKILDITVEGVSLLATQRSEFDSIVGQKGIDGLIEALHKQVAAKSAS